MRRTPAETTALPVSDISAFAFVMISSVAPALFIGDRTLTNHIAHGQCFLASNIQPPNQSMSDKCAANWVDTTAHAVAAVIGKLDTIRLLRESYARRVRDWRLPATRAVVHVGGQRSGICVELSPPDLQAYRLWKKRAQISERHAVKRKAVGFMQELAPAPFEEVFLVRSSYLFIYAICADQS